MRATAAWAAILVSVALRPSALAQQPDDAGIVLAPVHANASLPEKMLVMIPGGNVPNAHYIETAKAIQSAAAQLRLWVAIPAVFKRLCIISCAATIACAPLHQAVESTLATAADMGWKRADDSADTWLAGHSLGGVCANTLFQAYRTDASLPYAGLIVMGSYVDESGAYDLAHYPKPVFVLNGELDGGLARPGKTSLWWRQHKALRDSKGEDYALLHKPVAVLPKMNHSDFCPGFDVPGDLPAEVDQATATRSIGGLVAGFLHANTPSVPASVRSAFLSRLKRQAAWTEAFLAPYLKAQDMERSAASTGVSEGGASPFCAEAQHIIAGMSAADDARLDVADGFHAASTTLEHCHPSWSAEAGSNLSVHTCSHADYYADLANTGSITAASQIACKLLSSARVAQQLKATAARPLMDCREGNKHAVRIAEQLAAPSTRERFRRKGRGWCFLDDTETPGDVGPIWIFSSALSLVSNSSCMAVSSPVLKTALDGQVFPGSHYCKFLSPARVLDWMMTDSLKPAGAVSIGDALQPARSEAASTSAPEAQSAALAALWV